MKRIASSIATLLTALGSSAFAADMLLANTHPIAAPIPYTWTGIYVGGHIGYGSDNQNWNGYDILLANGVTPVPVDLGGRRFDGGLAGGQLGGRYQVGTVVIGVEGEYSWADLSGRSCDPWDIAPGATYYCRSGIDGIARATGQVGVAFDRALFYLNGGVAWVHTKDTITTLLGPIAGGTPINLSGTTTGWRSGWTMGAAAEYALSSNWSARVSYDYISIGATRTAFVVLAGTPPIHLDIENRIHSVKFGINYKFDWGGPLVARN